MNFVYRPGALTPMTAQEVADAANDASPFRPFSTKDFDGPQSRTQKIRCHCNGYGELELEPLREDACKRYVKCRLCGGEFFL